MGELFQKTAVNLESIAPLAPPNGAQTQAMFCSIGKTKLTGLIRSAVCKRRNLNSPWRPTVFSNSFMSSLSMILIPARSLTNYPLLNKVRQATNGLRRFLLRQRYLGSMPKRFLLLNHFPPRAEAGSSTSFQYFRLRMPGQRAEIAHLAGEYFIPISNYCREGWIQV